MTLVVMMGYFLVKESATYYAAIDGNHSEGLFKALILEGVVLTFTVLKSRAGGISASYRIMTGMIYLYTLWALSGSVIQTALQEITQVNLNQKVNRELEGEIAKKEIARDSFSKTDQVTLARKIDLELQGLRQKLEEVRKLEIQIPNLFLVWNRLATLIAFRVLVMLSNLLCVKELCRLFRLQARPV